MLAQADRVKPIVSVVFELPPLCAQKASLATAFTLSPSLRIAQRATLVHASKLLRFSPPVIGQYFLPPVYVFHHLSTPYQSQLADMANYIMAELKPVA